ncbi:MAG: hypothetical protein JXB47_07860 [Anaerolineae bacterium]|nr:hypothetical protein [Anaerolineae bacterium]
MTEQATTPRARRAWIVPAVVIAAAAALVLFGPEERALGAGIKIVYVHVALTWAGMVGLGAAGLLGAWVFFSNSRWEPWLLTVGRVATAAYAAGFVVSLGAEQVNWGGIYWNEPRTIGAMQVTAVALIVQVVSAWLPAAAWRGRARGLLSAALFGFVLWQGRAGSLLHPDSAASASDSSAIQLTFLAMFALCCLGMVWLVWYIRRGGENAG